MAHFTLLDQLEEDKLHATRLLNIEEKPFKRLTKRLLAPSSPIQSFSSRLPTPPAEELGGEDVNTAATQNHEKFLAELRRFREDVILDFAAFESSIARIQFLRAANEQERERYAAEKLKIEATAQDVRENTARLRIQLDEAQKTLAVRKTYDVLAEAITSDPSLKPRHEQHVNIEKLRAEIEDLEHEGKDHDQAWMERREQMSRLVMEGARLRRMIRDEKDEPEKGEEDVDVEDAMLDVQVASGMASNIGTPRPVDEGGLTPRPQHLGDSGGMTPRSVRRTRANTPQHDDVRQPDAEVGEGAGADSLEQPGDVPVISEPPVDQMDTS